MNNVKQKIFEKTVVSTRCMIEDYDPTMGTEWTYESITSTIAYLEDLAAASTVALDKLVEIQDMFCNNKIETISFNEETEDGK